MAHAFLTTAIRLLFAGTSRGRAMRQAERELRRYLRIADGLPVEAGSRPIEVPPMRGIDEDMRRWSFFMILEHNVLVNRSITAMVAQLARGEPLSGAAVVDPKTDVMPSPTAGAEQVRSFAESVRDHVGTVRDLGPLRGTATAPHPVFGAFDAHQWNCMFAFHLRLHHRQAESVVREAAREQTMNPE